MLGRRLFVAAAMLIAVACVGPLPSTSEPTPTRLLTDHPGPQPTCAGAELSRATVRGRPDTPNPIWLEVLVDGKTGRSHPTIWPAGYTARFDPDLQIIGPSGAVFAREGDVLVDVEVCSEDLVDDSRLLRIRSIGAIVPRS